jgi:DNA-binding GntR family transcriptional regulator
MTRRNGEQGGRGAGPGAPTSKADLAYETILQSILEGEYEPGERLVIERLARELDVSVVPVREAIRRLESDGYITFTRNVGATVASIDLDRYPETIETVAALEGVALGLAVPHLSARDLAKARSVNDRLRRSLDNFDAALFTRLNKQFHQILFSACPNRHILSILEREWALLETTRRSAFTYIPDRAAASVEEHQRLLEMIESGVGGLDIELFAREHRMSTARRVLQHLGALADDASPPPGGT